MSLTPAVLRMDEQAMFSLRGLYHTYGYTQYKVKKFEEYDLYVQNKNFLPSKQILSFHDTNGELMAMKPDVTLSIIKNTRNTATMKKVYYTEHVYRVPRNASRFCEILQTGLECIGDVDLYAMSEVLMLAVKSLEVISPKFVLNLSHIGVLSGILEAAQLREAAQTRILRAIAAKNPHELEALCTEYEVPAETTQLLQDLTQMYGSLTAILPQTEALPLPASSRQALQELKDLQNMLSIFGIVDNINLDFSIVNNMDYYNGLFFRGFIDGLPEGILSGGQYDKLMQRMGKKAAAIGFAVYLDQLERFHEEQHRYDVDALILYDDTVDFPTLIKTIKSWTSSGKSVRIQRQKDDTLTCRQLIAITGKEVKILAFND